MTPLTILKSCELQMRCAQGHNSSVLVDDLLALSNPPTTDDDALKRARCKVCAGPAIAANIGWAGKPNNMPPR